MESPIASDRTPKEMVESLERFIDESVAASGGSTAALRPSSRIPFHWPPDPISYKFHVTVPDWNESMQLELDGETCNVEIARTSKGVFARCTEYWNEGRGETLEEALAEMVAAVEPLFDRQRAIAEVLGSTGRFTGTLRSLAPEDLLRMLYCRIRDVAHEAIAEIEKHASGHLFFRPLVAAIEDRRHPMRRQAQWCALDLFEDLPSHCDLKTEAPIAVKAMQGLLLDAQDDYARTVFKAGVVLGGHLPGSIGGPALLECLKAESRIGRRSAIHGLFHVVEWDPSMKQTVVEALEQVAKNDPDPLLRDYSRRMAHDVQVGGVDHVLEPTFPGEL